jgi:hypothetical protein
MTPPSSSPLKHFLLWGPDPPDPAEPPSLLEILLPWPVRLLLVGATLCASLIWRSSGAAESLGWALAYGGAVAVSLAASLWKIIFTVNVVLGTLWLFGAAAAPPDRHQEPLRWFGLQAVELFNRETSHFEAFWIWMSVAFTWTPRIDWQLPLFAFVTLLGTPLINWAGRRLDPTARKADGSLLVARRPAIYASTFLGLCLVVGRSHDGQIADVVPLALAVLAGLLLRVIRIRRRKKLNRRALSAPTVAFRSAHRRATRAPDVVFGPVAPAIGILVLVALVVFGREVFAGTRDPTLDPPLPPGSPCTPERPGPSKVALSLFLLADSHAHELGGERFPGQTEIADALADTALRPVELDMLSNAPVKLFARGFKTLADEASHPFLWAHLGDFDDLSCAGEFDRAKGLLAAFPPARFAGISPGNHDSTFTGNFFWSPFWTPACEPVARLDKRASLDEARLDKRASLDEMKRWLAQPGFGVAGRLTVETPPSSAPRWLGGSPGALFTLTPLAVLDTPGGPRAVVAVFLDSADGQAFDYGIAGHWGDFSPEQDARVRKEVKSLVETGGASYAHPIWIVMSHHRLEDMTKWSAARLKAFLEWLDGPDGGNHGDREPRLLAYLSAHDHHAETHHVCIGQRLVRELVVGSTIDPPQQAAVLDVGIDQGSSPSARLTTIQAVRRGDLSCGGDQTTIDAAACRRLVASLKEAPACEPLLREPLPGPACSELEHVPSIMERFKATLRHPGIYEPAAILDDQRRRARDLLGCVCRPGAPGADASRCATVDHIDPFVGSAYQGVLDDVVALGGPDAEQELVCLSWAAAAVQRYKANGMTFATALRCAFDDRDLSGAEEVVATLEKVKCP